MKKFLLILLLLPVFTFAQTSIVPVGTGEYDCYFINTSGKLYHLATSLPSPMNVPSNLTWKYVAGGLHNGAAIDNLGHVWTLGDNSAGVAGNGSTSGTSAPSQVLKDSSGRVFDSVVAVTLWYNAGTGILAVKSTGTLWIWGNLAGNMRGNGASGGTWTKPVQVVIPGNRKVVKVCANNIVQVLCSDGTVWTWGGAMKEILGTNSTDYSHPHQVILPQAAKDVASGGPWSYAVGADGTLYGWGMYTNAMFGTYTGYYLISTPLDLKKYMGFPLPVSKVFTNSVASYFILTDGSLWSCGDNVVGSLGNGKQYDQSKGATPYAVWPDPAADEQLLQPVPTRIGPAAAKFVNVFVATPCVFYFYAQDANGQLYSAGRNKGGVLGNGVRECDYIQGLLGSQRPNSWNVPTLTAVNPLALKTAISTTSPFCKLGNNQNTSPCNLCALQPITQPASQPIPGTIQAESYSNMSGVATQVTVDLTGLLNVGWIDPGDWMDYTVNVATAGTYTVNFRVAAPSSGSSFQLKSSGGAVLATVPIKATGGFQIWQTVSATVTLPAGNQTLRIYAAGGPEWNFNWMQFASSGPASYPIPGTIQAESYSNMSGIATQGTADAGGGLNVGWIDPGDWMDYNVNVAKAGTYLVNLRIATPYSGSSFQLRSSAGAVLATVSPNTTGGFQKWQIVSATVTLPAGNQTLRIYSTGSPEWNLNWMQFVSAGTNNQPIPGKIEAESYSNMSNILTQPTSDAGGGMNVGWIDPGNWMDYTVNVAKAGAYTASFRIAAPSSGSSFQLRSSGGAVLATMKPGATGGFQKWQTVSATVTLPAGNQTLRIYATGGPEWNLNWMQFVSGSSAAAIQTTAVSATIPQKLVTDSTADASDIASSFVIYPNPVQGPFMVQLNNAYMGNMRVQIVDVAGMIRQVYNYNKNQSFMQLNLSAGNLSAGTYFIRVQIGAWSDTKKMSKL